MPVPCPAAPGRSWLGSDSAALDTCLAGVAQGDQAALASLYHSVATPVYSFALSLLRNSQDAEDVLHDCVLRVAQAAPGYRSQGKPLAWLITIARNLCLQKLAERQRFGPAVAEQWADSCWDLPPEERLLLDQCLNDLGQAERQIVVLHAVAGFRHREIAALLDLPLATELSKYHRALKKLRQGYTKGERR